MGKKSRLKRERKLSNNDMSFMCNIGSGDYGNYNVSELQTLFSLYDPLDLIIAINVSELWPDNLSSQIKHIFAYYVLLNTESNVVPMKRINTYNEFKLFIGEFYRLLPKFIMLEDYVPEFDWGHVKIKSKDNYYSIFYNSIIERANDFIESFRISSGNDTSVVNDMHFAIQIQDYLISKIPELSSYNRKSNNPGYLECPPEWFWNKCSTTLRDLSLYIKSNQMDDECGEGLSIYYGKHNPSLASYSDFANSFGEKESLPFIGCFIDDQWMPISIRNATANIIDVCGMKIVDREDYLDSVNHELSKYLGSRIENVLKGSIEVYTKNDDSAYKICSLINTGTSLFIILTCKAKDLSKTLDYGDKLWKSIKKNCGLLVKQSDGEINFSMVQDQITHQSLQLIVVPLLFSTYNSFTIKPESCCHVVPISDLITIIDSIVDINELAEFWDFYQEHRSNLIGIANITDIFASYKESNALLLEGAVEPLIFLDPHLGNQWRFNLVKDFWKNAPKYFPSESTKWIPNKLKNGVVELVSNVTNALAYSLLIDNCTVQFVIYCQKEFGLKNYQMLDLFAQIVSDRLQEHRELLTNLKIFDIPHLIINCVLDSSYLIDEIHHNSTIKGSKDIIINCVLLNSCSVQVSINVNNLMLALINSNTSAFELECAIEFLESLNKLNNSSINKDILQVLRSHGNKAARYRINLVEQVIDVPEHPNPIIPTVKEYKIARRDLAIKMKNLGLKPGDYQSENAKPLIDEARVVLRQSIESKLAALDNNTIIKLCIQQHDSLLVKERNIITRTTFSLTHEVDYDRSEVVSDIRQEVSTVARNYRYLLEKMLSMGVNHSTKIINHQELKEILALVEWYMSLSYSSDTIHNQIDVTGINIDTFFVPTIFYSEDFQSSEKKFLERSSKLRLGIDTAKDDSVDCELSKTMYSTEINQAFLEDMGFNLINLFDVLSILTKPVQSGICSKLSFVYSDSYNNLIDITCNIITDVEKQYIEKIIQYLIINHEQIKRLSNRDLDEDDVPFWEHNKRLHRYVLKPLIMLDGNVMWGSETVSKTLYAWQNSITQGYLPADINCPNIKLEIDKIKKHLELKLESKADEIVKRFTTCTKSGIDFYRKYKHNNFDDVGDFDLLAYFPRNNTILAIECKYNKPPFCLKDSRRLRDEIFGKDVNDKKSQMRKILLRQNFIKENRSKIISLLNWPEPKIDEINDKTLYVSKEIYFWMIHDSSRNDVEFLRIDELDDWLNKFTKN